MDFIIVPKSKKYVLSEDQKFSSPQENKSKNHIQLEMREGLKWLFEFSFACKYRCTAKNYILSIIKSYC